MFNTSELYVSKSGKVYILPDRWLISGTVTMGALAKNGYRQVHPEPEDIDFKWQGVGGGLFVKTIMGVWCNGHYALKGDSRVSNGALYLDNKVVRLTNTDKRKER